MIDIEDKKYIKSYKQLSHDGANGECLINIEDKTAIDFDDIAEDFGKEFNIKTLKSCDALIRNPSNSYTFIEFKNGKFDETEIRDKLYFSIFMLGVIEDKKVSEMQIEFELVYNPIAIFTISRKKDIKDTVNVQVDGTRRAKQELRKMQYHNDNIQKSIKGYNEKYPRKGNSIVKMNATDKTSFVEREQNII